MKGKMTKILIGALGFTDYNPIKYDFGDGKEPDAPTKYSIFAIAQKTKPDTVIVLLTDEAQFTTWEMKGGLQEQLGTIAGLNVRGIKVPSGANEEQLWEILDQVASVMPEEGQVTLDITLGHRSLPTLLLSMVSYMRQVRKIQLSGIYYGALVFGNPGIDGIKIAPVFDLTLFDVLLDWATAVKRFKDTGDLLLLADLLDKRHATLYRSEKSAKGKLPTRLKSVVTSLRGLSSALDMIRPLEVMDAAIRLGEELKAAELEIPQWAKPFGFLLEELREQLSQLSLLEADSEEKVAENLQTQYRLIKWYAERSRWVAASVLTREWLVSWYMHKTGRSAHHIWHSRSERENAEKELSVATKLSQIWGQLGQIRNDIAHCGFRESASPSQKLRENVKKQIEQLALIIEQQP